MITTPARALWLTFSLVLLSHSPLPAADWPRWLGPNGDNIAPADGFSPDLTKWRVQWKTNIGIGYSAVTVAGGRAYTLGHDGKSQETLYCLNAENGALIWSQPYPAELMPAMHPGGPNATPTVFNGKVFTVSKDGQAFCFSADKGEKLWSVNLVEAMGVQMPKWGIASSPVVYKDKLLYSAGRVVQLEQAGGRVVWISPVVNTPGYSTPVVFRYTHNDYIATLDGKGLSILVAGDGSEVTRQEFKAKYDMNANTPIVSTDGTRILASGNMNSVSFRFDGKTLTPVWDSKDLKSGMSSAVRIGDVVYGVDGAHENAAARLVCLNWEDGKVGWAREKFGYGTVIGIGQGLLLALTENGELVTAEASTKGYSEGSRLQVLGRRCWTPPVYAGGRIYVRNEKGDVVCLGTK